MTAANKEISKQAIKNKQGPNTLRNRKKRLIKKAKRNARKSEGDQRRTNVRGRGNYSGRELLIFDS